jgi:hypothetical protein
MTRTTRGAAVLVALAALLGTAGCRSEPPADLRATEGAAPAAADAPPAPQPRDPGPVPDAVADTAAPGRAPAPGDAAASAPSRPDTLRGTVAVVGSAPMTAVVLRTPAGLAVQLTGEEAGRLRGLGGAEVWVEGAPGDGQPTSGAGSTFHVRRFVVRAVDGEPALDGVLLRQGDAYLLERVEGGRVAVAEPPDALRALVGQRVWITVPAGGGAAAFGRVPPTP